MKDGKRWYCHLRYKTWAGETKQHKKEGFKRKSDAQAYEKEFLMRVTGSPDMTVSALYSIYMEDCAVRLRMTTNRNKDAVFKKHILPTLGEFRVADVSPAVVRRWQNEMTKNGFRPSTLKFLNSQLTALFSYAVKYYGLKANPVPLAGRFGSCKECAMSFLTLQQFRQLISHVHDKEAQALFSLLFWTGLRIGEAMALTPSDFDFQVPALQVSKTFTRIDKRDVIQPPKTAGSRRTVILTDSTARMMQAYISALYGVGDKDRIFRRSVATYRGRLNTACDEAGVNRIRIHDFRHSHASLMIELGVSALLISERLGHDNVETTLKVYAHLYPNKQVDLVKMMNEL